MTATAIDSTARRLMEGNIYIPVHVLGKRKQAVDTPANAFTGR